MAKRSVRSNRYGLEPVSYPEGDAYACVHTRGEKHKEMRGKVLGEATECVKGQIAFLRHLRRLVPALVKRRRLSLSLSFVFSRVYRCDGMYTVGGGIHIRDRNREWPLRNRQPAVYPDAATYSSLSSLSDQRRQRGIKELRGMAKSREVRTDEIVEVAGGRLEALRVLEVHCGFEERRAQQEDGVRIRPLRLPSNGVEHRLQEA